jgi:ABC-type iron transport system FetAB permease component
MSSGFIRRPVATGLLMVAIVLLGVTAREAALSIARGLVQMALVGVVLALLLNGSLLVGTLILLAMTVADAVTAARRARDIDGATLLSFWAIAAGPGVVIAGMLATGTLQTSVTMLVRRQHDHCQRNECLRAGCRTLPSRCHRARRPSGGRPGTWG